MTQISQLQSRLPFTTPLTTHIRNSRSQLIFVTHISRLHSRLPFATPVCDSNRNYHSRLLFATVFATSPLCDSTTDRRTVLTPQRHLPNVPTLTLNNWNLLPGLAPTYSYCPPSCPPPLVALCLLSLPLAHHPFQRSLPPLPGPLPTSPHLSHPLPLPPFPLSENMSLQFLMKLPPTTAEGQNLRSWELDTLQYGAITVCFPSRDTTNPNSLVSLKPNSIRHLIMLRKYIHHLVQDSHLSVSSDATDHALEPDNFLHTTFHQFMSWKLDEITTSSPSPPPSVTASDPRAAPSTPFCSTQLLNFKRGIKRDISAYPTLKDEKYYESFQTSVLVTATANDCEEILQPTFRPRGDADSLELLRLKNDFMYSVFNKCLLSDMGKTIVRKHLDNMNAQRVWEEFATHMTTSSKGKAEKCRLHTFVTTTVLDKSWKGTTEQFILHFNEQFRQLDEVSPPEESLPYTTRLTLLQTAVHNIPELTMLETIVESSAFPPPHLALPWAMTTTSLYSKMHALGMIVLTPLSPLQPLELPTNMNYLLTSMTTPTPQITPPQAPPMVALTCQLRNSTRSTLPTSIGLLLSPLLPLGSLSLPLLLADPTPEGLMAPSFFLPTSTNS